MILNLFLLDAVLFNLLYSIAFGQLSYCYGVEHPIRRQKGCNRNRSKSSFQKIALFMLQV